MNLLPFRFLLFLLSAFFPIALMAQGPVTISSIPESNINHSLDYNLAFERTSAHGYGWSGGDHIVSVELPFCSTCPTGKKNRRLWLFGDSYLSFVDDDGIRHKTAPPNGQLGVNTVFGNTTAITFHPDAAAPARADVEFDWGLMTGGLLDQAWLGLTLDTQNLPDMNGTRIFLHGYNDMGFGVPVETNFRVFNAPSTEFIQVTGDRVPIYEYYSAYLRTNTYTRAYTPGGGYSFEYRRVAFYVLPEPISGETVPLYKFYSSFLRDTLLTTTSDLGGYLGYGDRQLLGHVYEKASAPGSAVPLWQYWRYEPSEYNGHHKYTTARNDTGISNVLQWPLGGIAIDNDLVLSFSPVAIDFTSTDHQIFSIIRNANLPHDDWGKPPQGPWTTVPDQYIEGGHSDIRWGRGFVKDDNFENNRLVYIMGARSSQDIPGTLINSSRLYLARVVASSADDVVDFTAWEFYTGDNWSVEEKDAEPILFQEYNDNGEPHEVGLGANTVIPAKGPNGTWMFANSNFLSSTVSILSAPSLTGPWTVAAKINLYDVLPHERDVGVDDLKYYAFNTQQGLSLNGAQDGVLISYVRSTSCWIFNLAGTPENERSFSCQAVNDQSPNNLKHKASVYTPRFIDVPWSSIFPAQ